MTDIQNKISYLKGIKNSIRNAIIDKGVDVSVSDTFRSYAEKIALIEGGGSGTQYDYNSQLQVSSEQKQTSPSFVSLSNYVLPDYTIKKEQIGLLYPKRVDEKQAYRIITDKNEINFTKMGSITVSEDFVASDFSETNYLKSSFNIPTNVNMVKTICHFKTGTSVSGFSCVILSDLHHICIMNGRFWAYDHAMNTDTYGSNVSQNKEYWGAFVNDNINNKTTFYLLSNGERYSKETLPNFNIDWVKQFEINISNVSFVYPDCNIYAGTTPDDFRNYFKYGGLLYLDGIEVSDYETGEVLFSGIKPIYQYTKGICTKDFIPQAGTNTLNAYHIEYVDGTSECLLGQTEPTGEDIKSVQLLESGLTFEEDKAWTYNEDSELFE